MARRILNANGKTASTEELICRHMCNHYRRILNAKKVVDTSPPHSYKIRLPAKKSSLTNRINKPKQNRNVSPAMTDRSLSTNSYKASSWGTESFMSSSRYHANCVPPDPSPSSCHRRNLLDMKLINQITYDTKNGPAAYCDQNWTEVKAQDNSKKPNVVFDVAINKKEAANSVSKFPRSMKSSNESDGKPARVQRKSSKVMIKQTQSCTSFGSKNGPKILKTEAVSKLRSLRVYYPPRRKKKREPQNLWNVSDESGSNVTRTNAFEICLCSSNQRDIKKPADVVKEQTSSRDSAYNGGVSSLPESRSPTPDHKNKLCGCLCDAERVDQNKTENCKYFVPKEKKNSTIDTQPNQSLEKTKSEEENFQKMKEDALYVKFIQDITVEILEKGLFTNKAIKKMMRKHIINNLEKLDKDRMLLEVENLRIQLGVPEDKDLLEIENINEDSFSGLLKAYPVISDSALSFSENPTFNQSKSPGIPKSISETLEKNEALQSGWNSDSDILSVIQIGKKLRERMPSVDSSSEESNPNKKKRPKVSKFPKAKTGFPKSFISSSSSSECEDMNKGFEKEPRKNQFGDMPTWTSPCTCEEKKNRSVTFDKTGARQENSTHIQLLVCTNDTQKNDKKVKTKND